MHLSQLTHLNSMSLSEKLGYAGLVPFIASAVAAVVGIEGSEHFFKVYSVLILCFMAGGCWGVEQANPDKIDEVPLELSIGAMLWAMMAYFLPPEVALPMLLAGFWILIWVEANPLFKSAYSASYKHLRMVLTSVVSVLHLIVFLTL